MSICVALNEDGTLSPTGQTVADCTGYVLTSPGEVMVAAVIASAFEPPDLTNAAGWFAGVFSLIVICYVAGRGIGAVVNSVR
jgi:hypothetical protein